MLRLLYATVIWASMTTWTMAQYEMNCGPPAVTLPPTCGAPEPGCGAPGYYPSPNCAAPEPQCRAPQQCYTQPCCPPRNPTQPPRAPQQQPPQGYFAAPPQNGTVAGGSNTVAVEGFALHFPALTLKLPTVQLPSLTRVRTPPRMYVDQAQAPYVPYASAPAAAPFAVQRMPGNPASAPENDEDEPARAPSDKCGSPAPNCAAPAPRCDAPAPNCNAELEQRLQQREQQIARLEEQMMRLGNTMERFIEQSNRPPQTRPVAIQAANYEEPARLQLGGRPMNQAGWGNDELRRLPPAF